MTFAGVGTLLLATGLGDFSKAVWTVRGTGALIYLIVCGSLIGYTAYIWLLAHVNISKVSTYAYVNPVIAVFLGWLILHEQVDKFILAGTLIIITSVVLVNSANVKSKPVPMATPRAVAS